MSNAMRSLARNVAHKNMKTLGYVRVNDTNHPKHGYHSWFSKHWKEYVQSDKAIKTRKERMAKRL